MNKSNQSRSNVDNEENPSQELRAVVSSCDETSATPTNNIPMSLRDLVTQTDADGNALSVAHPPLSRSRSDSLPLSLESEDSVMDIPSAKKSLFRSIFCCLSASSSKDMVVDTRFALRKKGETTGSTEDSSDGSCTPQHANNSPLQIQTPSHDNCSFGTPTSNSGRAVRFPTTRNNANSPTNGKISSRLNYGTGASTPMRPEYMNNSPMRPLTPQQKQIPELLGECRTRKPCLVLDLDETLVHSSFQKVPKCDFVIPVAIEGTVHKVYVIKRPGVDEFLERAAEHYELIVYTASLSKYANPLLDVLDPKRLIDYRLFREHCVFHQGHYVKDLSLINRDLNRTIIIDNSPMSYIFHPCKFSFGICACLSVMPDVFHKCTVFM